MAYPTTGGCYNGQSALHVRYADGDQNTELYYTSHEKSSHDGMTVTTLHLKDYVTKLEVDLVYEAHMAEDVIITHDVKVLESRRGTQATQAVNPSFMISLDGTYSETSGEVVAGVLAWSFSLNIFLMRKRRCQSVVSTLTKRSAI